MSGAATRSRTRPRIERAVKPQHDSAEIAAIHAKLKELEALIKSMAGADGKDGKDGAPGKDGTDGKDGAPGKDGTDGKDGAPGKDGTDSKNGNREIVFTGSGTPAIYMRIPTRVSRLVRTRDSARPWDQPYQGCRGKAQPTSHQIQPADKNGVLANPGIHRNDE